MTQIQVLNRAIDILELLAEQPKGLGVTEISNRAGLHKSTVHRILSTLMRWGYVEKNGDANKYRLGLKVIDLGSIYLNNIELKTEALPYLRSLVEKSMQTVHLAILDVDEVVYIEKVDVVNSIRMYSQIGRRVKIHCTALGKVLTANLSHSEIDEIINTQGLPPVTENTITDKETFLRELKRVKQLGYAIDDEEHEIGIRCISAPVYDYRGKVIAAISTSGSIDIFTYKKIDELIPYVKDTALKISIRLGYRPHI